MKRYNPNEIEPKWQQQWSESKIYEASNNSTKPKLYASPMLPYPSGTGLHTGHVRNYAIADAIARFYRQRGFNTMSTMAWDSFGLPAENYAIKTGTPPAVSTAQNIAYFKSQLQRIGMSYDWSREFNTSDPSYYKWTQWLFSVMFERGLAYQAEKAQWWCDQCKTVLADEQVVAGKCWRHDGATDPLVTKKNLNQWFFKISDYVDRMLDATDELDWPEKIKIMQKNWIGRSEGVVLTFGMKGLGADYEKLDVFTTAIETIHGVTFLVLAPEHPLVSTYSQNAENGLEIKKYVDNSLRKSEIERESDKTKTGIKIEGLFATNPINGSDVAVWVADYVLSGYGSGAVMGVPGEDKRDNEFATKFEIPIIYTTDRNEFTHYQDEIKHNKTSFTLANSGEFDGMNFENGQKAIMKKLSSLGVAEKKVTYKIRDWLISRQRYWGAPIPIIHCQEHGAVLVPADQLPVVLPEVESFAPDGSNHSILAGVESWVQAPCPTCGVMGRRETDTMDGYVCSTWYLHRYTDAHNANEAFSKEQVNNWLPVDFYFGADHAVAHLLYIRFFNLVLVDMGILTEDKKEPVKKLVYNGYINAADGSKMSKSKGNTVDPMDIINKGYGADSLRLFELFIAPYDQDTNWNDNGVPGTHRFLSRIWTLTQEYIESSTIYQKFSTNYQVPSIKDGSDTVANNFDLKQEQTQASAPVIPSEAEGFGLEILRSAHRAIKKVTDDLNSLSFNTAVSAMMTCVNELYLIKAKDTLFLARDEWKFALESILQLLAPFAPHMTEELWQDLGNTNTIHVDNWPTYEEKYLVSDTMKLVVQINGKVRAEFEVETTADKESILSKAKEVAGKHLEGQVIKKEIYVPNKLVSFVI